MKLINESWYISKVSTKIPSSALGYDKIKKKKESESLDARRRALTRGSRGAKSRSPSRRGRRVALRGTRGLPGMGARSGALENTSAPAFTSASEADHSTSSSESWILNSRSGKAREA